MPKSYLISDVTKIQTEPYLIPIQGELFEYEGPPEIRISLDKENYYKNLDRYNCHHDYKHKRFGKVYGQTFQYYYEPKDFYMYYSQETQLAFIQTNTDIALDYLKRLSESNQYEFKPVKINFAKMYPLITEITGSWIAELNQTYLKTAGLFGPNVNKSEEFKQAAEIGEVSSLQIKYIPTNLGEELLVRISKKGSIVLYDTFERVEDEIDVVIDIYEKLIKPAT